MKKLVITICLSLVSAFFIFTNAERVSEILKNASTRVGEIVEVDGLVTQLEDAKDEGFKDYWLKDKYGGLILIHTDGKISPITNKKYTVKGYLTYNNDNGMYFISETGRTKLSDDAFVFITGEEGKTGTGVTVDIGETTPWWEANFKTIAIVGSIFIVLLIVIAVIASRKKKQTTMDKPSFTSQLDSEKPTKNKIESPVSEVVLNNTEDLKTMIIPKADPKTMKFIPGKLEVLKGADIGKTFKIAGTPQKDGSSVVTIGREASTEANMFSHIQLKEHTISRKQAQIIESNGIIKVKNLSATNFTKIDGKELLPNETQDLKTDSIITLGEVEVKYSN